MWQVHVPTLMMLLPALLPLAIMTPVLNVEHHVKVTPLQHGNLFQKLGLVYVGSAFGHLVVPIHLKELRQHRQDLDLINQHVQHLDEETANPYTNQSVLSASMKKKVRWMKFWVNHTVTECLVRLDDALASFSENATMLEGSRARRAVNYVEFPFRSKRQIIVGAIGAGLGAAITGIISKYEQDKLVKIMNKRQEVIIAQLEKDEVSIHQNSEDIHRLNQTVGNLIMAIYRLSEFANNTNYVTLTLTTTYSVTETVKTVDSVLDALESARSGTFNINLGKTQSLKRALNSLAIQGIRDGRVLGIKNLMDLQHAESSYLVDFDEEIVYTIAHVQMPNPQSYLTLYSYQGSPIAIHPKSRIFAEVEYKGYVALAKDNSNYQEWNDETLKQCKKYHSTWYCPETVRYQRKRTSCLTGLYDSDAKVVHELCPINLVHSVSLAKQINATAYVVTETEKQQMTVTCANYKTKVPIQGTVILNLKPGCVASTENLVINHPKIVSEVTVESKLITTPIKISIPPDDVEEFLDHAEEFISIVGQKVPMKLLKSLMTFKRDIKAASKWSFTQWISSWRPGSLLGNVGTWFFVAFLVLVLYWIGRCACARYRLNQGFRIVEGLQVPPNESISFQQLQRQNDLNEERDGSRARVLDSTRNPIQPDSQRVKKALQMVDSGLLPDARRVLTEASSNQGEKLLKMVSPSGKEAICLRDQHGPKFTQLSRSGWKLEEVMDPEMTSPDSGIGETDTESLPLNNDFSASVPIIPGNDDSWWHTMMRRTLDTNPKIEWFRQNPGCIPNEMHDLEMEALTTFPFTSLIEQCPPDHQTGLIDPNRVAKVLKKRRQIRISYFEKATPSQKRAMEKKELEKYQNYRGERTIPNISNAINPDLL